MKNRRSKLIWCACGAALANLSFLAGHILVTPASPPPANARVIRHVGRAPYEATLGRLIECGATRFWLEDWTDRPPVWVLEASRDNNMVVDCFDERTVSPSSD